MNGNNENKANLRQKKQRTQLIGLLAGILLATIAGSGCSSMHKITSSYQVSDDNEIESSLNSVAASTKAIDANCSDTGSALSEQDSEDCSSEDFFAETEEDYFESESDDSEEGSQGLSRTVNGPVGDVFSNIASILSRYTELGNASNDTLQTSTKAVAANSNEIAQAWQAAVDVNGNCVFSGSDITRLVANFKGLVSLNHCSLVEQAGE